MELDKIATEVFEIEAKAIANLTKNLTEDFSKAVEQILLSKGKLIVTGMGKSGIIGKKMAATFASTGTPSFFLHPGEAYHGDLGMVEPVDTVLLISNSGETDEVLKLIPFFKNQGNKTISMSKNPNSTLGSNTNFHLNIAVEKEACPLRLAPTSSTTATLVMGDALAVALMRKRGFKDENFAKFHPGGSLGRKLLTKVMDVMKATNLPVVTKDASIKNIVQVISEGKVGLCVVEFEDQLGVITDGDIRRAMENASENFFSITANQIATKGAVTIKETAKLVEANELMLANKINTLLVVNEAEQLSGIIQTYDINIK